MDLLSQTIKQRVWLQEGITTLEEEGVHDSLLLWDGLDDPISKQ